MQMPAREHAPLHPANPHPPAACADSPAPPVAKGGAQAPGQAMPAGELVTRPRPETATVIRSGALTNVAVAVVGPLTANVHNGEVPEQPPDHDENFQPALGTARSETCSPLSSWRDVH